jgi:hypothetical protein
MACSTSCTHQLPFWRSLDSLQLIPASRMRSTIAIAVRHRSNSSFCCALKASSGLAGLRIILDGITHSSAVRRERGRVSQPLTPRVKSVMPLTSTYVFDSVFNSEHSLPERLERLFSCPHHRSYTERCASRPLVQQRAANARGDAPLLRSSSKQSARCMSVGGDRNDVDEALRSSSYAAGGSAIGLSATDAYRQSLGR